MDKKKVIFKFVVIFVALLLLVIIVAVSLTHTQTKVESSCTLYFLFPGFAVVVVVFLSWRHLDSICMAHRS